MKTAFVAALALASANAYLDIDADNIELIGAIGDDLYTAIAWSGAGDVKAKSKFPTYN